jgi:hypothetical protein
LFPRIYQKSVWVRRRHWFSATCGPSFDDARCAQHRRCTAKAGKLGQNACSNMAGRASQRDVASRTNIHTDRSPFHCNAYGSLANGAGSRSIPAPDRHRTTFS